MRADLGAEHGDDQPAAVALGGADEGVAGDVGEARLAAQRSGVFEEQSVVVLDRRIRPDTSAVAPASGR